MDRRILSAALCVCVVAIVVLAVVEARIAARLSRVEQQVGVLRTYRARTNDSAVETGLELPLGGVATLGRLDARIALVEFADFQCPYCARFADTTLKELRKTYVDTGVVLFAFRHLPIASHPL